MRKILNVLHHHAKLVTARTCFQSGWRVILVGCGSIFIALGKEEFQKHFFVIIASFCFSCGSFFFFFLVMIVGIGQSKLH